jgi:hypothetical protein
MQISPAVIGGKLCFAIRRQDVYDTKAKKPLLMCGMAKS